MRIIGGKDYYDSAAAYGIDPGIVFVRDSRKLTRKERQEIGNWSTGSVVLAEDIPTPEDPPRGWRKQTASASRDYGYSSATNVINGIQYGFEGHVVIFCGKVYRGTTITSYSERELYNKETFHFWTADRLNRWAAERGLVASAASGWYGRTENLPALEDMFTPTEMDEAHTQALIKHGVAIAWPKEPEEQMRAYRSMSYYDGLDSGWRVNSDGLKDIGFQSAVDPVTAFQELSMWVGGTLSAVHGPNVVKITDDDVKLAKHGMDKWSFRKQGPRSKL